MQYSSILPKWLKFGFTIPISLSLALLATMACGGDDKSDAPHTALSQDAGITGLEISHGILTPAFKKNIRNYGAMLYSNTPAINLTVTVLDEKSRLTINDTPAISGQAAPVALHDGANTINIVTVSEDGRNSDITTLSVNKIKPSTKVWVLDGVGGVPVENAVITLKDANNRLLEDNISLPPNKNGTLALGLDPGMKYNIYAKGKDSAQALYANFDPSRERDAVLYCLPHKGGGVFPYEAPIITDISFGNSQSGPWTKLYGADNHIAGPRTDMANIKITALSKCSIVGTSSGPFPMAVALDGLANSYSSADGWYMQTPTPRGFDGQAYFETICGFSVPGQEHSEQEHWLDIVVYDMANNRTERRVYLTFTNAAATIDSDDDLSNVVPQLLIVQAQTFGISWNTPAINPIDAYGAMYRTVLQFRLDTKQITLGDYYSGETFSYGIRGFEVYRSPDNINFEKIGTEHTYYTTGDVNIIDATSTDYLDWLLLQFFQYLDITCSVSEAPMYYKVRAFNGNPVNGGYSQFSNVLCVTPLPPFTTELTAPAHGAISDKIYPAFKFNVSNQTLIVPELSDGFYFTLYMKYSTHGDPVFHARFYVDFTYLDEEGNPLIGYIRYFDDGPNGPGLYWTQAVYDSGQTDNNGNPIMLPFAWIEGYSTFVVDTDNEAFQTGEGVFADLLPDATYEWNIFGQNGGIIYIDAVDSPVFFKEYPVPPGLPNFAYSRAYSFGGGEGYGYGAINGFSTFSINPDAK